MILNKRKKLIQMINQQKELRYFLQKNINEGEEEVEVLDENESENENEDKDENDHEHEKHRKHTSCI